MKKILSIDFDYFQKVSTELMQSYPLGYDRPADESERAWQESYSQNAKLREVGILEDELQFCKELLLQQNFHRCKIMIANSHACIYDFIHDNVNTEEAIMGINVDMHHDVTNDHDVRSKTPFVDCGNWVSFINREYEGGFFWLANPESRNMYGLYGEKCKLFDKLPTSIKELEGDRYDMIFLCRSDSWTPPHLDDRFSELVELILENFPDVQIEPEVITPRSCQQQTELTKHKKQREGVEHE